MRRSGRLVPLPPMPLDPLECRWCHAHMALVAGEAICPGGCTTEPSPHATRRCELCEGEFVTGRRFAVNVCWECQGREMRAMHADAATEPRPYGYEADMRANGANRHAIEALKERPS